MSTVTLEQIQAEHQRLATLIAQFSAQTSALQSRQILIEEEEIDLEPGEHYAGLVLNDDGAPSHHLILLPGEAEKITWGDAIDWADQAGGSLPSRREQALLYANCKGEFREAWYWSGEEHTTDGAYAWSQYFGYGNQYLSRKSYEGRARAVRLIPLSA